MSRICRCIHFSVSVTMTAVVFHLISAAGPSSVFPVSPKHKQCLHQLRIRTSRRDITLLSFISAMPSLLLPSPATAFQLGISGPKDWLKEQKKKASKFLLAPIDASRDSLHSIYLLLTNDSDYSSKDLDDIQNLLKSAARDCVLEDRDSFVQFQASTGVEVCTFRLIVNNASSLLGKKDPVKLEAETRLNDLISSFSSLNILAYETDIQVNSNRQKLLDAVNLTISSLDNFEKGIKDCLEV